VITINGKQATFVKGETILEAAKRENIYIPTLCTHHELPSFGACRMCLVEVENAKGYLTACTTPTQDGMVVRTETDEIQAMRRGVLELILSEHTSACILCKEKEECQEFRGGPIKTGRVTGCRFCPENQQCEIIKIVDYVGLEEFHVSLEYKDFPLRRDDPFIERDSNLCILCGRCVRVCSQIRGREAISFINRGNRTEVGTSFGRPLMDCGCMFCGACVDVCPTGSLSAKSTKWHGEPHEQTNSVCLLCGAVCEFEFQSKWDTLMAAIPREEGRNRGQACVRGRFCLPPLMNSTDRLKYPLLRKSNKLTPVTWEEALSFVSEKLKDYDPEEIGFVVSPTLTNEGTFLLQKLAREAACTKNIDMVGDDFGKHAVTKLLGTGPSSMLATFEDVEDSDAIIVVGSDLYLSVPLLTVSINRAQERGARLVLMDSNPGNQLGEKADAFLRPNPGDELSLLASLVKRIVREGFYDPTFVEEQCGNFDKLANELKKHDTSRFDEGAGVPPGKIMESALGIIHNAKNITIITGHDHPTTPAETEEYLWWLQFLLLLGGRAARFMPVLRAGNTMGVSLLGGLPDHGPGLVALPGEKGPSLNEMLGVAGGVKALYTTEPLPEEELNSVEFLVVQGPYPVLEERADVILPSAAFTEESGSVTSLEGYVHRLCPSARPPALAKSDWEILAMLGTTMGASGFDYQNVEAVQKEIEASCSLTIDEFWKRKSRKKKSRKGGVELTFPKIHRETGIKEGKRTKEGKTGRAQLPTFSYRGAKIEEKVVDFKLFLETMRRRGYHGQ